MLLPPDLDEVIDDEGRAGCGGQRAAPGMTPVQMLDAAAGPAGRDTADMIFPMAGLIAHPVRSALRVAPGDRSRVGINGTEADEDRSGGRSTTSR
ncbi:hypothetical protein [Pseudonocardia ailaonensis]|uniref:hypothetical protein n=1 Tax=Pseudonocardia ailaonensis TaxID=367279 RepID=UPI0031E0ABAB